MTELLIISFAAKHLTSVFSDSYITEAPRQWILNRNGFIGYGVNCFFCTSTWVGMILSFSLKGVEAPIETLIYGLAISGLANLLIKIEETLVIEE